MTAAPALHPDLVPLAGLLGEWEGDGEGVYPTISPFGYREHVAFAHGGKPFLVYSQRTWAADDGRPLHVEAGYWRVVSGGAGVTGGSADGAHLELVIAHPTGVTEISSGQVRADGSVTTIDLTSTTIGLSATAKSVTAVERTFRLVGDVLDYTLRMAAVGQPLQHHLAASLRRVDAP